MFKVRYISYLLLVSWSLSVFSMSENDTRKKIKAAQAHGLRTELRTLCGKTATAVAAAGATAYFIPGFGHVGAMGLLYMCKEPVCNIASCYGYAEETENMKIATRLNGLEEQLAIAKDKLLPFNQQEVSHQMAEARRYTGYGLKSIHESDKKRTIQMAHKLEQILSLPVKSTKALDQEELKQAMKELEKHLETYSDQVHDQIVKAGLKINNLNSSQKGEHEAAKASFWFVGEAGVGKTETAEFLAKALKRPFCKINIATASVNELLGVKAKTFDDVGQPGILARCFLKPDVGVASLNPIIFIDEVHDVLHGNDENSRKFYSLLKILTEGRELEILDEGLGIKLDLSHVVFIFGSNASIKQDVANALATRVKTITFDELSKEQKKTIAKRHFMRFAELHDYKQKLDTERGMLEKIVAMDDSPGARVLINVIEDYIVHQQACMGANLRCQEFDIAAAIQTYGGKVSTKN